MTEDQVWVLARAIAEYITNQGKSFVYKGKDGFWYARPAGGPDRADYYDAKLMHRVKKPECIWHDCVHKYEQDCDWACPPDLEK